MAIITPGVLPASALVAKRAPRWLTETGRFLKEATFESLPASVADHARLVLLDCLGAVAAGRAEPEVIAAAKRLAKRAKARRGSPLLDAFLDGTAGTMLEIDEGNQYARGHPAIHVVPAILAVAEGAKGVTGRDAILALVLGYEIGARIGIASKLRVAMHPHGTWGTVGAAVSVAKLARASRADLIAAINVASSLGLATSRRTMLEGGTVRNTYAGFSNMLGLMAVDLVKAGFTGERDGVGSVYGGIVADGFDPAAMTDALGTRWEIARNYFKRHAACRYTHGALDALGDILARVGGPVAPADVAAIEVGTYVWAAQLDHPAPDNMLAAKFSLPFALAARIARGAADLDAFRDAARADPAIRALSGRVTVTEDPALTAKLPALRPARVRLRLTDGRAFEALAETNRGDVEDPYSGAEVIAKFHEVAGAALGPERARALADVALSLDGAADLARLVSLVRGRP
jgi:2-methylcitrate dehydratase PrpD